MAVVVAAAEEEQYNQGRGANHRRAGSVADITLHAPPPPPPPPPPDARPPTIRFPVSVLRFGSNAAEITGRSWRRGQCNQRPSEHLIPVPAGPLTASQRRVERRTERTTGMLSRSSPSPHTHRQTDRQTDRQTVW